MHTSFVIFALLPNIIEQRPPKCLMCRISSFIDFGIVWITAPALFVCCSVSPRPSVASRWLTIASSWLNRCPGMYHTSTSGPHENVLNGHMMFAFGHINCPARMPPITDGGRTTLHLRLSCIMIFRSVDAWAFVNAFNSWANVGTGESL